MFKKISTLLKRSQQDEKKWALRAPRVAIHPPSKLEFASDELGFDVIVANISSSGIGFFCDPEQRWPEKGREFRGNLLIEDETFPLHLKVVRISPRTIGCIFIGDLTALKKALDHHFSVEFSASNTSKVNSEILKTESDGTPHLFRGSDSGELFFVESDGKLLRFQLSFFGNYIEGGDGQKTKFGHVHAETGRDKPKHKGSSLVQLSSQAPEGVKELAKRFIMNIPGLPPEKSKFICDAIENF